MIYFIVTTCLYDKSEIRASQYMNGITKLNTVLSDLHLENYKIIIVENNGIRDTFLNDLGCEVLYTKNNSMHTRNKGVKELSDIFDCIKRCIKNDDFIVKMTGRYILNNKSEFMNVLKNKYNESLDCILRFGYI